MVTVHVRENGDPRLLLAAALLGQPASSATSPDEYCLLTSQHLAPATALTTVSITQLPVLLSS